MTDSTDEVDWYFGDEEADYVDVYHKLEELEEERRLIIKKLEAVEADNKTLLRLYNELRVQYEVNAKFIESMLEAKRIHKPLSEEEIGGYRNVTEGL